MSPKEIKMITAMLKKVIFYLSRWYHFIILFLDYLDIVDEPRILEEALLEPEPADEFPITDVSPIPIMQPPPKKNLAVIQRSGMTEQQLRAITPSGRISLVTTNKRKIYDVLSDIDNKNNGRKSLLFAVNIHSTVYYFINSINFDSDI